MVPFVLAMESCAISNSSSVVSGETLEEMGFNTASEVFLCQVSVCSTSVTSAGHLLNSLFVAS